MPFHSTLRTNSIGKTGSAVIRELVTSKALLYLRKLGNGSSLPSLRFNTRPPDKKFLSTVNSFPANHEH
jgi:hypothetical protein